MRFVLVTALLALGMNVGISLPAAASSSEHMRQKDTRDRGWSDNDARSERRRVARATTSEIDEEYEARPSLRDQAGDEDRSRYTRRRQARVITRSRHHASRHSTRRVAHRRSGRRTAEVGRVRRAQRLEQATRRSSWGFLGGGEMSGVASYYWQGQRVATGARFNPEGLTAAHRTLPFGTRVRVTHVGNGRSVNVVINDRGPFIAGRIIDLARGAARVIGMTGQGLARVRVTVLGR